MGLHKGIWSVFQFLEMCIYYLKKIKKHNMLNSTLRSIHWNSCNAALPLHHFGLIMIVMPWYAMIAVGLVLPYNVHQGGGQVSRGRVMLRKLTLTRIWVVQSWSHDPYQRLKCTYKYWFVSNSIIKLIGSCQPLRTACAAQNAQHRADKGLLRLEDWLKKVLNSIMICGTQMVFKCFFIIFYS